MFCFVFYFFFFSKVKKIYMYTPARYHKHYNYMYPDVVSPVKTVENWGNVLMVRLPKNIIYIYSVPIVNIFEL